MTVLLAAFNKHRFHGVNDILFLLTHSLTKGVTLTTGKVGQLTRQQHHLFLIYRDAIGILQVFLHTRDIILDLLTSILSGDEGRDVVHRTWTIQRIHSDEILEHRRMEFSQILLHTRRLKLEGTNSTSLLIEFIGLRVVNGDMIEVDFYATCTLDIRTGLFQL